MKRVGTGKVIISVMIKRSLTNGMLKRFLSIERTSEWFYEVGTILDETPLASHIVIMIKY